jgi:glycosyltransferase involved in cell wall biosynthesis
LTEHYPKVSAIVAVKNGEKYIARALGSILCQEYPAEEIVVVDGRSTDNTVAVASGFSGVRVVHQENDGIADAYNLGIESAGNEIVAFLSCDDEWTPDKLRLQVGCLQETPELLFTIARIKYILQDKSFIPPGFRRELLRGDHAAPIMETLVARKEAFDLAGLFNTSLPVGEDADWFARAFDAGILMKTVQKVLLRKYVHEGNHSLNMPEGNRYLLQVLRESIRRKRADGSSGARK